MSSASPTTLQSWLTTAIEFKLDPTGIHRVVDTLPHDVRLLALGEPMHGAEEFLILRNLLFQTLATRHGYTAIAVESSFPRGFATDAYVQGVGDCYDSIKDSGFSHGFGSLDANRELIEWMRQANRNQCEHQPIRFYGFDSPTEMTVADSPRGLLAMALAGLAKLDAAIANDLKLQIESHLGNDGDWENPAAAFDHTKAIGLSDHAAHLRLHAEDLIQHLSQREPEWATREDAIEFAHALRHATHARQMLMYHVGMARNGANRIADLLGLRDLMMADNLSHILKIEQARNGKVLVFAHNAHLQRSPMQWQLGPHALTWWPAGAHMCARLGSAFVNLGAGVGQSEQNGLAAPEAGTLEALLTSSRTPAKIIATAPAKPAATETISKRAAKSGNPTYFPLSAQSLGDFDFLVLLKHCTRARGSPAVPT